MSCLGTNKLQYLYMQLSKVHNSDIQYRINIERPEQELIAKFLPSKCNVLEIGGESGTTSLIINSILDEAYKSKHVVVDPADTSIPKMTNVKKIYKTKFNIVHGFIGKDRTKHEQLWEGCKGKKMYSLNELETLISGKFDVLVIDCEGAFYNILNEFPEILDYTKLIIIEHDGPQEGINAIKNKLNNNNFTLIHSQCHPYINNPIWPDRLINTTDDLKKIDPTTNLVGFHQVFIKV